MSEMSGPKPLRLFEAVGIELEYMIVDSRTLDVRPIADVLLAEAAHDASLGVTEAEQEEGASVPSEIAIESIDGERTRHPISWSNELTAHVIELKTSVPVLSAEGGVSLALANDFQRHVCAINARLAKHGAVLMGGPMHPWMDPIREKRLWPHGFREFYEAFDRVFDCRGHGWANLQSMHINLPFQGDEEFARLHAAIRVLLPIMPALAAGSPFMDGRWTGKLDNRLDVYKTNARRVPSVSGRVIPEAVFDRAGYEREILERIYRDIEPHDAEGLLRHEWLNARGAIARFDRNAIEIRVLDVQEHPTADLGIAALIVEVLKRLANDVAGRESQRSWGVEPLVGILDSCIDLAEHAVVSDRAYVRTLGAASEGAERDRMTAGSIWTGLFERASASIDPGLREPLRRMLDSGTLATRLVAASAERGDAVRSAGQIGERQASPPIAVRDALPESGEVPRADLMRLCHELVDSLEQGRGFGSCTA